MVEPVPPLATDRVPVMAEEPLAKLIAELYKAPAEVEKTGRAWFRLLMVVEPLSITENTVVEAELTKLVKIVVADVSGPQRVSLEEGEVVPKPTLPLLATYKSLIPDELATFKISLVPLPWIAKV